MARDESGDGLRQCAGLVAMRRMSAVFEHHNFGVRRMRANALDLREGAVFVVGALQREYGASNERQQRLD
jgi:hypothetical protein